MAAKVEVLLDDYHYRPKIVFSANSSSKFHQHLSVLMHGDYSTSMTIHDMPEDESVVFSAR